MINLERSGKNFSVLRKINFCYRKSGFHNVFQILVRSQIFEKLLQQKNCTNFWGGVMLTFCETKFENNMTQMIDFSNIA